MEPAIENGPSGRSEGTRGTGGIVYSVGEWPEDGFGNHRAVVRVETPGDAVQVELPWRRRDAQPQEKGILIYDAATGKRIANVARISMTRENGRLVFQPATVPGDYHVYFMPCRGPEWGATSAYLPFEDTADRAWQEKHGPLGGNRAVEVAGVPSATLMGFEARGAFDRRDPMELIATPDEVASLLAGFPDAPYLVFPEDRRFPVRMAGDLPYRWIARGPSDRFEGAAQPGEYYVLQLGIWACRKGIGDVEIQVGDLAGPDGAAISASAIRCINLGGTDWEGRPFRKSFSVAQGRVRPLWVIVEVPENAQTGQYTGTIRLQPVGGTHTDTFRYELPPTTIHLALSISGGVVEEHGCLEAWRQSRLAWLDSTKGLEDTVVQPYLPLRADGDTVHLLQRSVRFDATGLPESLVSNGHELLTAPIEFSVEGGSGPIAFTPVSHRTLEKGRSRIEREWVRRGGGMTMRTQATVEFDGCIEYRVTLRADRAIRTQDVTLTVPLDRDLTEYFMGMEVLGGYAPQEVEWKWDVDRVTNLLWTGNAQAGIHLSLLHTEDVWPQAYNYRRWGTPSSWDGGGQGGCDYVRGQDTTTIKAYSGQRDWRQGDLEEFRFRLLITPFKPLDKNQWKYRYSSKTRLHDLDNEDSRAQGVTIAHLHQAAEGLNPWINYPFLTLDRIRAYRERLIALGYEDLDVYYTLREISNRISELWALRSLGDEIFVGDESLTCTEKGAHIYQGGGGCSWLQEHLVDGYSRAWSQDLGNGEVDAAIATQGLSRLHNFYVEGMDLLMKVTGCRGQYIDGLAYGRSISQRVARVMATHASDHRIKFHSGNNYDFADWHCNVLLQYAEHLPYITDLWIGEGFDYDMPPDYWLVEMSGIPFGLTSEMLEYEKGGNPWRGMLYAMDGRMHPCAPHLWKVWDDLGIQDAQLLGYWEEDCPVKTNREDVLASVYRKKEEALIALASWSEEALDVNLAIDWEKLGFRPANTDLYAPAIEHFQAEARFDAADAIPVAPGRGWLFYLGNRRR